MHGKYLCNILPSRLARPIRPRSLMFVDHLSAPRFDADRRAKAGCWPSEAARPRGLALIGPRRLPTPGYRLPALPKPRSPRLGRAFSFRSAKGASLSRWRDQRACSRRADREAASPMRLARGRPGPRRTAPVPSASTWHRCRGRARPIRAEPRGPADHREPQGTAIGRRLVAASERDAESHQQRPQKSPFAQHGPLLRRVLRSFC